MSSHSSSSVNIMSSPASNAKKVTKSAAASASATLASAPASAAPVAKGKAAAAAAPVAADAPAPSAPLAKGKKAAAATATATAATAAVATPAPTEATEAVVVPEEVRLEAEAKSITARLLAVRETVSELISEAKRLEKKAAKVQKMADKRRRRKAPVEGEEGKPARVSIFQVPTDISPALCAFMGRPAGSKESRSNVTKFVTTYVKEKNLKDKHDIKGDAALLKLLNLKAEDKLTYFNLQKYLNVHYLKKAPVEATA
jgi:chromatin remodeling complex protein RSC6